MAELKDALEEAIGLYLSNDDKRVHIQLEDAAESVTDRRMLVTC
jgi:hypothetical protein